MTTIWIATGFALLLCAGSASAQSEPLGDYARTVSKKKPAKSAPSHHYDNDNLPKNDPLSIVGPPPSGSGNVSGAKSEPAPAVSSGATPERQKANGELQKKIDEQKKKLDSLTQELDLERRENQLRVAQYYTDTNNRLQNSAKWDDENKHYQADSEAKQKAIDSARQQLEDLQEQARKAGIKEKDDSGKDKDQDTSKDDSTKK